MTDYTEVEIDRLHEKLADIYRRGLLTATEKRDVQGLWARIERLQSAQNKMRFRGGPEDPRYVSRVLGQWADEEIQ